MNNVVIVTGANSGIGLALCERLLTKDPALQLCLACRNMRRAQAARFALLTSHPNAQVALLQLDTSSITSILNAANEVKLRGHLSSLLFSLELLKGLGLPSSGELGLPCPRGSSHHSLTSPLNSPLAQRHSFPSGLVYNRLDYLYLNAGIMPNPLFDVKAFFKGLFSSNVITMFATGEGILTQEDSITADGMQEVFSTNLFGHFLLVRELEPVLCQADRTSHVIWTSSSNAHRSAFSLEDIQHQKGTQPYSSSKYASDLLSLALNTHLNKQGLYSSVICPGFVMTSLTYGILPAFPDLVWSLFMPIFWLIRVFTNTFTLTPYNGAEALLWLFKQKPESLDPQAKYHSLTSGLGNNYTQPRKMDIDEDTSEALYEKLLELEDKVRRKLKKEQKRI